MATPDEVQLLRNLGQRVRTLRRSCGLTSREAARRAELSPRFFSLLEGGQANIAISRLDRVAKVLGVSLVELLEGVPVAVHRNPHPRSVTLLGLRGAGKSTLGPRLAECLHLEFHELDDDIERAAGLVLAEIFDIHGEAYYRKLEERCLIERVAAGAPSVIALPGGVVSNARAFDLARSETITVWLQAHPEDHMQRVLEQGDHRPMANRPDAMAELRSILEAREPLYSRASITVDTSSGTTEEALHELMAQAGPLFE